MTDSFLALYTTPHFHTIESGYILLYSANAISHTALYVHRVGDTSRSTLLIFYVFNRRLNLLILLTTHKDKFISSVPPLNLAIFIDIQQMQCTNQSYYSGSLSIGKEVRVYYSFSFHFLRLNFILLASNNDKFISSVISNTPSLHH
jgi:hypothetical protein